jgi:glycosyltransferase involved in cell wall biosynthesis
MSAARAPIVLFLPAHDEAATVGQVVARAPALVDGHPVVVVVIDDGSTDGTADIARAAGAVVVPTTSTSRHVVPQGLGAAVRTGLADAVSLDAVAVAFCDADGEYDTAALGDLVGPILAGQADYVIGSRFAGLPRRMLPHRWLGNHLLTLGLRMLVRRRVGRWGLGLPAVRLTDGQSGYRALSADAARSAEVIHDFNYAQVLTLDLLAKGFRYHEVPITYRFREHGRSFVRLVPYLRQVVPAVGRQLRAQSSTTNSRNPSRRERQTTAS